eukprot:6188584-Pleurochrysis_carterae.AAC.4
MEVLDLAHDYYGARVAMSSSDQMIRVYNEQGCKTAEWKAHLGSIWRVVWAHPEFGSVIGSCSFDRKVRTPCCGWRPVLTALSVSARAPTCMHGAVERAARAPPACVPMVCGCSIRPIHGGVAVLTADFAVGASCTTLSSHPDERPAFEAMSFRRVCIWEELADAEEVGTQPKGGWRLQAELQEARDTVHDLKFAPKHLGLRLASASADKFVRVYEAADIMDLSSWELTQ